jgi:hypothetical protein
VASMASRSSNPMRTMMDVPFSFTRANSFLAT